MVMMMMTTMVIMMKRKGGGGAAARRGKNKQHKKKSKKKKTKNKNKKTLGWGHHRSRNSGTNAKMLASQQSKVKSVSALKDQFVTLQDEAAMATDSINKAEVAKENFATERPTNMKI